MDILTNGKTAGCILLLVLVVPVAIVLLSDMDFDRLFQPKPHEVPEHESTAPYYATPTPEYNHDPPGYNSYDPAPPTEPPTKSTEKSIIADELSQFLAEWERSQETKNLGYYMEFYHRGVDCRNMDYSGLQHYQTRLFDEFYNIELALTNAHYRIVEEKIEITFVQEIILDDYYDVGFVTMMLIESENGYVIVKESWEPYQY